MHPRHRSPGNGYRSGSMSMGMGLASSRISPEGSFRSHGGIYGSEYRSFNRSNSFARGQGYAKPFHSSQHPLPPSGRSGFVDDIFMEAGRLAAEYLVSKGLLPSSTLSSEWENGSSKMEHGEFHESRMLEGENIQYSSEGRPSALASRLGNAGSDAGSTRRRSSDEFSPLDLRNQVKGKRKAAPFRAYESNRSDREYGRSASLPDRARVSLDMEPNVSARTVSGYKNQYEVGDYTGEGLQKSISTELPVESENKLESEPSNKKACSDDAEKLPQENEDQFSKVSDSSKILTSGMEDVKDNSSSEVPGGQSIVEKQSDPINALISDLPVKPPNDLLALCGFAKFPTKIRSALSYKGSKIGRDVVSGQKNPVENSTQGDPEVLIDSKFSEGSIYDTLSKETNDLKLMNSEDTSPVTTQGTDVVDELYPTYIFKPVECGNSQTLVDRDCLGENEPQSGDETSVFGENSFVYKYGGQKRAPEVSDIREETKKPREILSPMAAKEDSTFHLPDFSERKFNSDEEETPAEEHIMEVNCASSMDFGFPKNGVEPCVDYGQEKQLFPSSFKICDLNLMEATDMHENHGNDPIMFFPSVSQSKREKSPFGMDLSMTNSNKSGGGNNHIGKEIEIIDLEDDLVDEDKPFNNADRKTETLYTSLDTFPDHTQNTSGVPDVQDGYGLISELLGADFPNCSSVSGDINLIDNEMVLHNEQVTLADDDSIYMSLGEIPLTFLRAWEQQPTQEYEKPF